MGDVAPPVKTAAEDADEPHACVLVSPRTLREPNMISCTLEQVGDRLALVLDQDAVRTLRLRPGDTVRLEPAGEGLLRISETWVEDPHARGRAFLKRYTKSFTQLG